MYILMPVPKCLSMARRRLHMRYDEAAKGICSREMFIQYEKGYSLPSKEIAIQLANRLQISPGALVLALYDDLQLQEQTKYLSESNELFFDMMQHRQTSISRQA